jgi:hypothetical protein
MKRVFASQDDLLLGHLKNVLENHGIECVIQGEFLAAAAGAVPPIECAPELVVEEQNYDEARAVLDRILSPEGFEPPSWRCPRCGEEIEGQFTECWGCGQARG